MKDREKGEAANKPPKGESGWGGRRPGSGRKTRPAPVTVSLKLRGELLAAVDGAAEREGKTRYRIIAETVKEKFGSPGPMDEE
jgi:hypothetical protein